MTVHWSLLSLIYKIKSFSIVVKRIISYIFWPISYVANISYTPVSTGVQMSTLKQRTVSVIWATVYNFPCKMERKTYWSFPNSTGMYSIVV